MSWFKVLETSFIGQKLCQPGEIVDINTDVDKGGMRPGKALAACDEEGNLSAAKPAAKSKAPKADAELG